MGKSSNIGVKIVVIIGGGVSKWRIKNNWRGKSRLLENRGKL